jgi:hypothetical protein
MTLVDLKLWELWIKQCVSSFAYCPTLALLKYSYSQCNILLFIIRCRSLSLNIFFPVQAMPLISMTTYRGVLLEFPVKLPMTKISGWARV